MNAPKRPGRRPPAYAPLAVSPDEVSPRELVRDGALNLREAAKFLACSERQVKRLIRRGDLRSCKSAGRRVVPVAELRRYLTDRMEART